MKTLDTIWNEAEAMVGPLSPVSRIIFIQKLLDIWKASLDSSKPTVENPTEPTTETTTEPTTEPTTENSAENSAEIMGKILFELSGLSKDLNINVSAALRLMVDYAKIDKYG